MDIGAAYGVKNASLDFAIKLGHSNAQDLIKDAEIIYKYFINEVKGE